MVFEMGFRKRVTRIAQVGNLRLAESFRRGGKI